MGSYIDQTPYQAFAKIFSSYHDQYAEHEAGPSTGLSKQQIDSLIRSDAVLDEEGGLLSSLSRSLEHEIQTRPPPSRELGEDEQITEAEHAALLNEHRTWQLIRSLYEHRLSRHDPAFIRPSAAESLQHNPYMTPEDLTQLLVLEDDDLSLYAVLVEHLQSRPFLNSPPPLEARHGYLPSTARRAKAAKLSGGATNASYDPDFTLRDAVVPGLAGEDQTYQTPLMETLWDLVRHGELDEAIRVAEESGEPWRGASLMGGRRWTMGGLTSDNLGPTALEGNRKRALWKKACRAIAKNPSISEAERSLYAAMTSDLPTLLPTCKTWEDHLWARVLSRIETQLEYRWRQLGGFWEQEARAVAAGMEGADESMMPGGGRGMAGLFHEMSQIRDLAVVATVKDPYHVVQSYLLQGNADTLITGFAAQIPYFAGVMDAGTFASLIRFFTHLILVLRSLGQEVPDVDANTIIEAYLTILREAGHDSLVAMYAACLRAGSGETSYARFLLKMDPEATREQRGEALGRAKAHHLDVSIIAREIVESTIKTAFAAIPALSREPPDPSLTPHLTPANLTLIRSIEWLTLVPDDPSCQSDALVKANDIARYFLALGQTSAAQVLLNSLPSGIESEYMALPDEADEGYVLEEYHGVIMLFAVLSAEDAVWEISSREMKDTATKIERFNWRKQIRSAIDNLHALTIKLLKESWMKFPIVDMSEYGKSPPLLPSRNRAQELARIRQTYIPNLILRLHALLLQFAQAGPYGEGFPDLVNVALGISTVVADEEHQVYKEFLGAGVGPVGHLGAYLERVRMAYLMGLRMGVVGTGMGGVGGVQGRARGVECYAGAGEGERGEMRVGMTV